MKDGGLSKETESNVRWYKNVQQTKTVTRIFQYLLLGNFSSNYKLGVLTVFKTGERDLVFTDDHLRPQIRSNA